MYYSAQDTATPARVGAYALGVNVLLNAVFLLFAFRYLSNGSPALASSLAAYFNFVLLFVFFRKRYGALGFRGVAASLGQDGGLRGGDGGRYVRRAARWLISRRFAMCWCRPGCLPR